MGESRPAAGSHQQVTKEWWRTAADRYDLFVSRPVLDECGRGDADAARDRLTAVAGITLLAVSIGAERLSAEYVRLLRIPPRRQSMPSMAHTHPCSRSMTW